MRTTLDVDDDVLIAVKERAKREHRSAGAVISELARRGLTESNSRTADSGGDEFFGFAPLPPRGRPVSNTVINQLRDEDDV